MTANNLRAFPVAPGQPQPASVPYSTFRYVCDERDRLRDELADLRAQQPSDIATPEETERGEALIVRALEMTYRNDSEERQRAEWARAFASPAIAALLVYPVGVVDTLEARRKNAPVSGWWTPGRVALVMAVLAILAIVLMGR